MPHSTKKIAVRFISRRPPSPPLIRTKNDDFCWKISKWLSSEKEIINNFIYLFITSVCYTPNMNRLKKYIVVNVSVCEYCIDVVTCECVCWARTKGKWKENGAIETESKRKKHIKTNKENARSHVFILCVYSCQISEVFVWAVVVVCAHTPTHTHHVRFLFYSLLHKSITFFALLLLLFCSFLLFMFLCRGPLSPAM